MAKKKKAKDFEYFKEFLENPASYKTFDFYNYIRDWIDYIKAHEDEFNYLEDDDWKEIRERVLEELDKRQEVRYAFEEIEEEMKAAEEAGDDELYFELSVELYELIKENQYNLDFTDEQIAEGDQVLEERRIAYRNSEIAQENLRLAKIRTEKAVAKFDDCLAEYYKQTGKRLVFTSLKRFKGN